jgi:hypothetical protein
MKNSKKKSLKVMIYRIKSYIRYSRIPIQRMNICVNKQIFLQGKNLVNSNPVIKNRKCKGHMDFVAEVL